MKFLFSSSNIPEIELVKAALVRAGIRCEIRHNTTFLAALDTPIYPELWIQTEEDYLSASMLFASRGRKAPSVAKCSG